MPIWPGRPYTVGATAAREATSWLNWPQRDDNLELQGRPIRARGRADIVGLDTAEPSMPHEGHLLAAGDVVDLAGRSVVVLRREP